MARSVNTDPFMNYKFHLVEASNAGKNFLTTGAGFTAVTMPDLTVDPIEYKTGIMQFKQKYPGFPVVTDITLTQGIFRAKSPLYEWILAVVNGGNNEYRRDLIVFHYHLVDKLDINVTAQPSRVIKLNNCFPTSIKATPDLTSEGGEISVQEVGFAVESFSIKETVGTAKLAGKP